MILKLTLSRQQCEIGLISITERKMILLFDFCLFDKKKITNEVMHQRKQEKKSDNS